ncbi:MAG TPA: hypothetical protein VFB07_04080 [Vicinamibacterales bacterium]|nr:hypothetical protein [Vicinamibacterales bacterium]
MRAIALTVACLLAAPLVAAERHWQTGTWTDISTTRQLVDFGPGQSSFGPPNAGLQMRALADVRVFTIDTDEATYVLRDTVPITRRSIDAEIGAAVTFAVEKNTVYVRDANGAEHKLRLTKKTPKAASPTAGATTYAALGGGHLLRDVSGDGRFLMLEDGSRWEIHPRDRFQAQDWDVNTSLTVRTTRAEDGYGFEIVNTQTDEGALARFVPRR